MKLTFTLIALCFCCLLNAQKAGTLDSSFGKNGKAKTSTNGNFKSVTVTNIGIQKNKKIVFANSLLDKNAEIETFTAYRTTANGNVDTKFGKNGKASIPFEVDYAEPYCLAVQPDDKIIIGGYGYEGFSNTKYYGLITRLNPDGFIDSTFGTDGRIYIDSKIIFLYTLLVQQDGKIVASGAGFVVRYLSNGKIDSAFGENGFSEVNNSSFSSSGIQQDGKILLCGYNSSTLGVLIRLQSNGKIDSSFGLNGLVTAPIDFDKNTFSSLGIQADNKIVVACTRHIYATNASASIYRFLPNGSTDINFGDNGKDSIVIDGYDDIGIRQINLQKNGKIIGSGSVSNEGNNGNFLIVRLLNNGKIDSSFGSAGFVTTDFGKSEGVSSAAFQSADQLIACGQFIDTQGNYFTVDLARYWLNNESLAVYNSINAQLNTITGNVSIYPNPAQNILHVEGLSANAKLTVVDFNGNIKSQAVANASSYNLNIASLYAGNYLLKIEMNGEVVTKQFVKE
jgi:uncharacterized delta-60 repeat protein